MDFAAVQVTKGCGDHPRRCTALSTDGSLYGSEHMDPDSQEDGLRLRLSDVSCSGADEESSAGLVRPDQYRAVAFQQLSSSDSQSSHGIIPGMEDGIRKVALVDAFHA